MDLDSPSSFSIADMSAGENQQLRLLPSIIDSYAVHESSKQYAQRALRDDQRSLHFQPVTYQDFAFAVNRACWWLDENLPEAAAFTFCGPQDLRWTILFVAAIKTRRIVGGSPGWASRTQSSLRGQMLFLSPWAVVGGLIEAFKGFAGVVFISDSEAPGPQVDELLRLAPLAVRTQSPSLAWFLLHPAPNEEYPYNGTWDDSADAAVACFHTSGSTGT